MYLSQSIRLWHLFRMSGRAVPMRVGDLELLIETSDVVVVGSEATSTLSKATQRVEQGFDEVRDAIVEVASSVADTTKRLAERGAHPDRIEVEFGLKLTMAGSVIVAGAAAEATLRVLVSYEKERQD
jgi:hypothetical protein